MTNGFGDKTLDRKKNIEEMDFKTSKPCTLVSCRGYCNEVLLYFRSKYYTVCLFMFTGIKDASQVNADISLGDLGLDSLMGVEVKQTLERDFDVNLSMKEIRLLSLNRLKEISDGGGSSKQPQSPVAKHSGSSSLKSEDSGISTRYNLNQIIPDEAIVLMNEANNDKPPLFLVHPLEGKDIFMLQVYFTASHHAFCEINTCIRHYKEVLLYFKRTDAEIDVIKW